jgi:hypothetical protein
MRKYKSIRFEIIPPTRLSFSGGGTDPSCPSNTAEFDGGVHQSPVSPAFARNHRPTEKGEACHGTKADAAGISDEL